MVKKLISFDDEAEDLGLPAQVETRMRDHFDGLRAGGKNLFNPETDSVAGHHYRVDGSIRYNENYVVTKRYPVEPGQSVAISGLGTALSHSAFRFMHFWDDAGDLVSSVVLPDGYGDHPLVVTDWIVEAAPDGAASFSVNISEIGEIPDRLQIEMATFPSEWVPYYDLRFGVSRAGLDAALYTRSEKNLYDEKLNVRKTTTGTGIGVSSDDDDIITSFIPVEYGKTYAVSGLDPTLCSHSSYRRVLGYATNRTTTPGYVKNFDSWQESTYTVTIDHPDVKFLVVQLSRAGWGGDRERTESLRIQVEEGGEATAYEPYRFLRGSEQLRTADALVLEEAKRYADHLVEPAPGQSIRVTDFERLDGLAPGRDEADLSRALGPFGPAYRVHGDMDADLAATTLFAVVHPPSGPRTMHMNVQVRDESGASALPQAVVTPFNVPSGQLLHEDAATNYGRTGPLDDYVHPSIAYDAEGIAGYAYWMVSSAYPTNLSPGVNWEDEEVFVSHDARSWLRIKSPYESARVDTAPGLSLPEHGLVTSGGRRHAFLPSPTVGDVLEISVPDSPRGPEIDRQVITITDDGGLPWKHDPAILIHDGYVYVYHSFHLPYPDRPGGQNRFVVLTRTSDGVAWEGVRSDGSTWPITATTTGEMFTKDDQGRYNYLWYAGVTGSNPEVIKWGEEDFEFYYGANFASKYQGTAPWNFNFDTPIPMQEVGAGNHPGLLQAEGTLYLLADKGFYASGDRGQTFTKKRSYPAWQGGATGTTYKKAACLGEGGRVIVVDVAWMAIAATKGALLDEHVITSRRNAMLVQEFPSLSAFLDAADNGLHDAYVDLQIDQINHEKETRKSHFLPWRGHTSTTTRVNNPHQRVKLLDLDITEGDTLLIYATLVSRSGAAVSLNGLDLT